MSTSFVAKVFNFPFTYNLKGKGRIGDLVEVPLAQKQK